MIDCWCRRCDVMSSGCQVKTLFELRKDMKPTLVSILQGALRKRSAGLESLAVAVSVQAEMNSSRRGELMRMVPAAELALRLAAALASLP